MHALASKPCTFHTFFEGHAHVLRSFKIFPSRRRQRDTLSSNLTLFTFSPNWLQHYLSHSILLRVNHLDSILVLLYQMLQKRHFPFTVSQHLALVRLLDWSSDISYCVFPITGKTIHVNHIAYHQSEIQSEITVWRPRVCYVFIAHHVLVKTPVDGIGR